jgi:Tol biopolymer transport system component/DNA-binding winged helix-turn-helix (wHTH) protein
MVNSGEILEFGPYRLDLGRRLLTRDAQTVTLQPKTFELLVLLAGRQGEALSKDTLMEALWPDTSVQEASLTFQVSALRKALGEPAAHWIESVPKHGYRFATPVTSDRVPGQAPPRWRKWAAAFALAALLLAAVWFVVGRQPEQMDGIALPVTTNPGSEIHPSLSPDGSQVAFAWNGPNEDNFDIYVKATAEGEPIRLTDDPANDFAPAWSPDGRWIAFLRGPADGLLSLFVMPVLGGPPRKVTEVDQPWAELIDRVGTPNANLAWAPDGRRLAVTGKSIRSDFGVKLLLVDANSGETRPLTEPPPNWAGDFGPAFTTDGRMMAFVRVRSLSVGELWVMPLDANYSPAGEPRRVTAATSMSEPQWVPGTKDIVFSSGPTTAQRRLFRVSSQESMPKQRLLALGEEATGLSISKNGRMIYSRDRSDSNIWLLDFGQSGGITKPAIASTMGDREPDYSPDGHVVFTSGRLGTNEIWMSNADGSNPQKLTNMNGPLIGNAQWSPDGTKIVFSANAGGLFLLNPKTLQRRPLCQSGSQPRWSLNGRWIYFTFKESGKYEVWKTPSESCAPVPVTHGGGFVAQESPDGKYLYYSKGQPAEPRATAASLWRMTVGGAREERIAETLSYATNFDVTSGGVYFMTSHGRAQKGSVEFFDARTNKTTTLLETGKRWGFGLSASPNGREILYSVVDFSGSDLMYLDKVP